MKRTLFAAFAATLFSTSITLHAGDSCGYSKSTTASKEENKTGDIIATASKAGSFQTLIAAISAADLKEVLQGDGPFTVFAPTDEAFSKLPAGTVEELLKPENKEKLKAILTYHVVPGKVMAKDVKTMTAQSVSGKNLEIKVNESGATIQDARIVQTDVAASNGVIHVIDRVILPAS